MELLNKKELIDKLNERRQYNSLDEVNEKMDSIIDVIQNSNSDKGYLYLKVDNDMMSDDLSTHIIKWVDEGENYMVVFFYYDNMMLRIEYIGSETYNILELNKTIKL